MTIESGLMFDYNVTCPWSLPIIKAHKGFIIGLNIHRSLGGRNKRNYKPTIVVLFEVQ